MTDPQTESMKETRMRVLADILEPEVAPFTTRQEKFAAAMGDDAAAVAEDIARQHEHGRFDALVRFVSGLMDDPREIEHADILVRCVLGVLADDESFT